MTADLARAQPALRDCATVEMVEQTIIVRGMNCQSCVYHVGGALRGVPGVASASVDLAAGRAVVRFDASLVTFDMLQSAVEDVGYVAELPTSPGHAAREDRGVAGSSAGRSSFVSIRSAMLGLLGSALLVGFYFAVMTLGSGFQAAIDLIQEDWRLIAPLVVGFGVQIGLFARLRELQGSARNGSARAAAGASGGVSGFSMVACCAHHLADLLPFLGLSGLALFLGEYRQALLGLGIASNVAGIGVMVRAMRRCAQAS